MDNKILETIKNKQIQMKPRWHFILKTVLFMLGVMITMFMVIYLVSFIIFVERQSGAGFIPSFGLRGWLRFLITLPWLLILLSIVFIGVLELLVRRYAFAYRRPLLYSALGIIIVIGASSCAVVSSSFHQRFSPGLYKSLMTQAPDINQGSVEYVGSPNFVLIGPQGEILHVIITGQTRLPMEAHFKKGDHVLVFGDRESTSSIRAFGVRRIDY